MTKIKDGGPGEIPPVPAIVPSDAWDNHIRAFGVVNACEWFGYESDSKFTADTIAELLKRSEQAGIKQ